MLATLATRRPAGLTLRRMLPHLPVTVLIAAYALRFGLLSVQVQDGYGAPGYDMGIFDQGVWLLSRFHAPYVTVMGRDLFGDHSSFILLLAVPLYWVWPEAQTLLVLQTLLIAAAAVPIYLLARRRLESISLATALAAAYLLNPALQQGNLEQFHPEAFLVLSAALVIYAAIEWKPTLLVIGVVASLLVKEDTALLIIPLGLWVLWRRNWKWGTWIMAGALAWGFFATQVVIRLLLSTSDFYTNRIPFGGLGGLLSAPFVRPGQLWTYVKGGGRPFYMWQLAVSFGGVFLIGPEIAAIGILTLAENTLSLFPYMQQLVRHYSLPLVPVLAMGTVYAVSKLSTFHRRAVATGFVTACAFVSCVFWGLSPFSRHSVYPHAAPNDPAVLAINSVLKDIPPNAVVSAWYPLISHLDHRVQIYQWPTPFRATYWYLYTQEGQRLPVSDQVEYLAIPTFRDGVDAQVFDSIQSEFSLIGAGGGVSIYQRRGP